MSEKNKIHIVAFFVLAVVAGMFGGMFLAPQLQKNFSVDRLRAPFEEKNSGTLRETIYVDEETATIDVVEKTNSAVVSIAVLKDVRQLSGTQIDPFDDFFFDFGFPFEVPRPRRQEPRTQAEPDFQPIGGGSGFVIEADGLIVTNRHVIDDESAKYKVTLADGTEYDAEIVAKDPVLDVAMIRIDAGNLPTLSLGDSDKIKRGQTVIAIGNALSEFGNTVTRGVVSGIGRRVTAGGAGGFSEVIEEAIQTDAAINPGNSGGPLLNLAGEVIGINTAVSREGQLIGFAIPINAVKQTIESVRQNGKIVRPWLGVRYMPVTQRLAEMNNLPVTYGALLVRGDSREELAVVPGSPADKAGLVENDIILEVNGKKLEEKDSLAKEIAKYAVGETVVLKVFHRGKEQEIRVTFEEFPQTK